MSYNGKVDFGLLGDYDAMPDIEEFGEMLEAALAELLAAARSQARQRPRQRRWLRRARPRPQSRPAV